MTSATARLAAAVLAAGLALGAAAWPAGGTHAARDAYSVVALTVPLEADATGQAAPQTAAGLLTVAVAPAHLDGPGGHIHVEAWTVDARLARPDATALRLPAMVVRDANDGLVAARSVQVLVAVPRSAAPAALFDQLPLPTLTASGSGSSLPVPLPTLFPSSSTSGAASTPAAATGASTTPPPASTGTPHLVLAVQPSQVALRVGEQGSLTVSIHNDGDGPDTVRLTAQGDAPVATDVDKASVTVAAGATQTFQVRVTPQGPGSGVLRLLATGERSGTLSRDVPVDVAAADSAPAGITATLDPATAAARVGEPVPLAVHVRNDGPVTDTVAVAVAGDGVDVEPPEVQMTLPPGGSGVAEFTLVASRAGPLEVAVAVTSAQGAALHPVVLLEAADDGGGDSSSSGSATTSARAKGKGIPAVAPVAVLAALLGVGWAMRRRLTD